jgi:hypothetical protein
VIPASGILSVYLRSTEVPDRPLNQVTSGKYVEVSSSAPISIMQEIGEYNIADATVVYPPSLWGTIRLVLMFILVLLVKVVLVLNFSVKLMTIWSLSKTKLKQLLHLLP